MARAFTASEIATEAGVSVDLLTWIVEIGIVKAGSPATFVSGDVFRVKLVSALLDAGVPKEVIERAAALRWLDLDHVDAYLPAGSAARAGRTFEEFAASLNASSLLPAVYEVLGLPRPDPSSPLDVDEEALLERFVSGWRGLGADDDVVLRAARLLGEGARTTTMGWAELLNEEVGRPTQARLAEGQIDRFPRDAALAIGSEIRAATEMFAWLTYRFIEHRFVAGIVDGVERHLASHGAMPMPEAPALPAIAFVDLTGFTRLTEERGDEEAVRAATLLQRRADAIATHAGGRLVKLLGDGALLHFPEAARSSAAAIELVDVLSAEGTLSAHAGIHAGPVIERDLDVFGATVNLASRIAGVAGGREVLASEAVVDATNDGSVRFDLVAERALKGISQPVRLFRVRSVAT